MASVLALETASKLSEENVGKAEAMFSFSEKLFRLNDGNKIKFVILESSRDSAIVSRLVELGGGSAMIKPNFTPNVINLCCYCEPWMNDLEIFNTSYVFACCSVNKKLSLREYSIGKNLSDEEYKKFDQEYLYSIKNEICCFDSINCKNERELKKEGEMSPDISSIHSYNGQESYKCSEEKYRELEENHHIGKHIEGNSAENCLVASTPCCLYTTLKRRTCLTLSRNTGKDVAAALEIYPEDSVSQGERESVSRWSSSIKYSSETLQSNSLVSEWDRSVRMWISDCNESE